MRAAFAGFAVFLVAFGVALAWLGVLAASQRPLLRFIAFAAALAFVLFGLRCLYDAVRGRVARWFEELIYMESQ